METVQLSEAPIAKAEMLIRKPVNQVFDAFIDLDITIQFWFPRISGRVEGGKQIRCEWEMGDFNLDGLTGVCGPGVLFLTRTGGYQTRVYDVGWLCKHCGIIHRHPTRLVE